ncbi:MAG: DUF484 family protein [Pseudomonadota bacterium]
MEEDDIHDFLMQNPDYLQRNPELLGVLHIPHSTGSAVSLVERQVSVLRERNVDLRHRLRDLGQAARDNDQLFEDTRALVLALLETRDLDSCEAALLSVLRDRFALEYASLMLFDDAFAGQTALRRVSQSDLRAEVGSLLGRGGTGCGALRAEAFAFLFPAHRILGSAAVAEISLNGESLGALAVGSASAAHYSEDMGTLFLEFTAEVLARLLVRFRGA